MRLCVVLLCRVRAVYARLASRVFHASSAVTVGQQLSGSEG